MVKYVYFFGEGNKDMKNLLGGKGAGLNEMTKVGIPVPPGFTITTEVCNLYYENSKKYPEELQEQIEKNLVQLEEKTGKKLGNVDDPLLVSVRSGAPISMPGMMDTVLNLGLNDKSVEGLAKNTNNERFAYDAYRRFIQMFGNVVLGIEHKKFEKALTEIKETKGVQYDTELNAEDLKKLIGEYKKIIKEEKNIEFPQDPKKQLQMAIDAVFESWNNERAIIYRKINKISDDLGTAVNVQTMVFGNMGNDSGTGVCFTRNPSTGEKELFGEFLMNAQGEDVVAGIRTPLEIKKLKEVLPESYKLLKEVTEKLEKHYKDMQDIEFTIEHKKLFLLQTRTGKRTAKAAVKIAVDLYNEDLIDKETAVLRVDPNQLNQLLHKQLDPVAKKEHEVIAKGLAASPGAAYGHIVFHAEDAVKYAERKEPVILVREETSPEDIEGMAVANAILTARGGMTSHAAVVARGMGKCCVVGCSDIIVHEDNKEIIIKSKKIKLKEEDVITVDGTIGEIYKGQIPVVDPELNEDFRTLMEWADSFRILKIRTNADIPRDAKVARKFGAEGIGLCRTEHMFFEGERIKAMREMILAKDLESRKKALSKLLPMQKSDFIGLYKTMKKLPVTIRLLDPPLHEFLPKDDETIEELANEMNLSVKDIKEKIEQLHELNPMLGHRGCRLLITYPEIAEMQTQAIIEAACELKEQGYDIIPEIMIPLVGHLNELKEVKRVVKETADRIIKQKKLDLDYKIGTMIEVPRAALTADDIAKEAEFFSFGTNDLTQMTFGFSRDDVGKFINEYLEKKILKDDPFQKLDQEGVGQLINIAVDKGRKIKQDLKIGICGEHGGEPSSVEFCHRAGLDYVSCSPYRVPIARLAAAQAAIKEKKE